MSNKHEFKTIVVPYDGSDQAKHAFSMACDLIGDDPDAKLMLLHVVPSGMVGTMDNAEGNTIDGVPWGLLDYETYKDVVNAALDRGRRGLGALRGMLGSVSYGVLHSAEMPVLTVK